MEIETSTDDADWAVVPKNPANLKVVLDPGLGGPEPGAVYASKDGLRVVEKDVNLKVALKTAGIIGEGLFISNDEEAELLRQEYFLNAIANAYVVAINRYFASEGK